MEQKAGDIINSICDLKDVTADDIEILQTQKSLVKQLTDELKKDHQESSLYFSNAQELGRYLDYLIDRIWYVQERESKIPESAIRRIECDCGSKWKLWVRESTPASDYSVYGSASTIDSNPNVMRVEDFMERVYVFRCSVCGRRVMLRDAIQLIKMESEHIPLRVPPR